MIGPFFYIPQKRKIIYNACKIEQGEVRADKYDNPYGHSQLWDDHYTNGDYAVGLFLMVLIIEQLFILIDAFTNQK